MNEREWLEMDSLILEKVRQSIGYAMSNALKRDITVHSQVQDYGNRFAKAIRWSLLGCEIRREVVSTETVPVSWWDAIKARFYLIRRLFGAPIMREIKTEVKHWHTCPHLNYAQPDGGCGARIHFEFLKGRRE